jgi:hypothetical protein
MSKTVETVITPETYLDALGIDIPAGTLTDPDHRAVLYGLVVEFLGGAGAAEPTSGEPLGGGLEMRLMRTAVHVKLGMPTLDELKVFVMVAAVAVGAAPDPEALTAAAVFALRQRIAKTDARFGERSVVDAVLERKRATAADVVLSLHGKPCRHPAAGCRYLDDGLCGLILEPAERVVEELTERQILKRLTAAPPPEYRIAI